MRRYDDDFGLAGPLGSRGGRLERGLGRHDWRAEREWEMGRRAGRFGWFRGPPAGLPRRDWRETYDTEYRTGLG